VSAASCFLTARALEQIKADVAYSNRNVKLCGMSPGVAYGELGPTHHSIEDIAWLRAIDNIVVVVPADPAEPPRPCAGRRPPTARYSSG
jgi:transketolase